MKSPTLLLIALLAPLPALADAPNFRYDYLDLGHVNLSPDNGQSGKGPYVDLSYSIFDGIQARVSYAHLDYSTTPLGTAAKDYTVGITSETNAGAGTDVYTDLLYVNDRVASQGTSTTQNGYRLAVGMRHRMAKRLELDAYLAHNYLNTPDNEAGVGLLLDATSWLSFGLSYAHDSQYDNTTTVRVRLYF